MIPYNYCHNTIYGNISSIRKANAADRLIMLIKGFAIRTIIIVISPSPEVVEE